MNHDHAPGAASRPDDAARSSVRRRARVTIRIVALAALTLGLLPHLGADATPLTTENACTNALSPSPSQLPMVLEGTGPGSTTADAPFTVSGLKVTGNMPAAYIQAGIGLGLISDGQTVTGTIAVTIHATNATVADTTLSGSATATVRAPGGVAQDLVVAVPLGSHDWTPTGTGDVTLSQALTGTASGGSITNGSLLLSAVLPFGTVKIACKPGTVSGTTATFATSTNPFVTVPVETPTTTTPSTTTPSTTTPSTTTPSTTTPSTTTPSTTTPGPTTTLPPKTTSLMTDNACTNALSPTPSQIPMTLQGTSPGSGSTGRPFTVSGLKVTGNVPGALIQAGIGLGLLSDGQVIPGAITVKIHAVNATPADVVLKGTTSATVNAPGGVARDLVVAVNLPDQVYTPTGNGEVTLSQALSGSESAGPITNGSILLTATLPGLGDVNISCRPGSVSGETAAFATTVGAFVTVPVPDATLGATTSTTAPDAAVLGATTAPPADPVPATGALPYTGLPQSTLLLVGLGLVLLDLGYLLVTATRPMQSVSRRRG